MKISYDDLPLAFEISVKFLDFMVGKSEISEKFLFLLLKNHIKIVKNSGMLIDYTIGLLKKLIENSNKSKNLIYFKKKLIKTYEIALFYGIESSIDLFFLFNLLSVDDELRETIEIFCPFFKKICEIQNFCQILFDFLDKKYMDNTICLLFYISLSKNFFQMGLEIDFGIAKKIFHIEYNLLWFNYINENRDELAFIIRKAGEGKSFTDFIREINISFQNIVQKPINYEKTKKFGYLIVIFLQNIVFSLLNLNLVYSLF